MKLIHIIPIISCAPLDRTDGSGSATVQVKARLKRFQQGTWGTLWAEATATREARPQPIRSAKDKEHRKFARAEHFAMHGHFREARTCLTSSGLLDTNDTRVREQIKALYTSGAEFEPMAVPGDLDESTMYNFELGDVHVPYRDIDGTTKIRDVFVIDYVLGKLPRYKAQGPDGMRYEHILEMPREVITLMSTHIINGALPEDYKPLYRSGIQLAGDKCKQDENGTPLARPIVIPAAFRRIAAVVVCAQLKNIYSPNLSRD
jgi:hypothetical protein